MDLDGSWKSPEHWPESSPPLPGWTRGPDGLWSAPKEPLKAEQNESDGKALPALSLYGAAPSEPVVPPKPVRITPPPSLTNGAAQPAHLTPPNPAVGAPALSFSDATVDFNPDEIDATRERREAFSPAGMAALIAIMLATGLVLPLALVF